MLRIGSTHWLYTATSTNPVAVFSIDLSSGVASSALFDFNTRNYLWDTIWRVLRRLSNVERVAAAKTLLERVLAATSLTGNATLEFSVGASSATAELVSAVVGEDVLIQIPFSGSMAMLPPTGTTEKLNYRYETLGDASTGYYHVSIAARGPSDAAIDEISISKNTDWSTPGSIGTFAISIGNVEGFFLHNVTVTTYTRAETQAKLLLLLDSPQGPVFAHQALRATATLFTTGAAQSATPIVTVANTDGSAPNENGIPYQLNPSTLYPKVRISAAGLTQASDNVVTDPVFNKAQSLVVQF